MLTFRTSAIFFGIAQIAAFVLWRFGACSLWPLVITLAAHAGLIAWGSMAPRLGFFIKHRVHGSPGTLALTFDDGPHPENTPKLLDALRELNVSATFFVIGRNVEAHPAIAKRIVDEGHAIGIHTQDHHCSWGFIGKKKARAQITLCRDAIERTTDVKAVLFRPPFGVTTPPIAKAVREAGVVPTAWDLRTFDTNARSSGQVMERIASRLDKSTMILLHDTMPFAAELARAIVDRARSQGTELVKLTA
jgi:peptidoglycan/xylan/chitin deacetylase (PgdA/CDA1 family)